MGEPDTSSETAAAKPARGGLSANAWGAITALGVAMITGVVTLVTHFVPSTDTPSSPGVVVASTTSIAVTPSPGTLATLPTGPVSPAGSASPVPRSALLDRLTGTWSGDARSGTTPYRITLRIPATCIERGPCGTMTTDLLPCVGNLTLVGVNDSPQFDFATGSFAAGSSSSCQLRPQGGDYFTLGDDVLTYQTGYDGGTSGTLRRVG